MKQYTIIGRRWFQKSYGNTYHTAEIQLNGITIGKTDEHYGYGDTYRQSAHDWLLKNGHLPESASYSDMVCNSLPEYLFVFVCVDVQRERDL